MRMERRTFRAYDQTQSLLLPPSLKDWLPDGHLAAFISEVVDDLDLRELIADYQSRHGRGAPPYDPRMLLKVLIYGYATGVFSSRKLAQRCIEDVAFRYLAAQQQPDFRTLIKFRARHLERFHGLFVQVVELAREMGLVRLGHLSIDGTKVRANASKHKAMSYGRMLEQESKLEAELAELLEKARATDQAEDEAGAPADSHRLPEEIERREKRLAAIQAARQRLEERARQRAREEERRRAEEAEEREGQPVRRYRKPPAQEPAAKEQENFTDPESRIMRDGATKGFVQAYNCQIAVDDQEHIIVAADVSNNAADVGELLGMVDQAQANTGSAPSKVSADAGYKSEANFAGLEERDIDGYVACGREAYDERLQAPRGRIPDKATRTERMARKLLTKAGRAVYRKRKHTAEPPIGWVKNVLGFRQFSLRGCAKVCAEWKLVCAALNLRRMAAWA
jgi:transposase